MQFIIENMKRLIPWLQYRKSKYHSNVYITIVLYYININIVLRYKDILKEILK